METGSTTNGADIIWSLVAKQEGAQWLRGYILASPCNYVGDEAWKDKRRCINQSGVTIGTSFDIGQRTQAEPRKLPFAESLLAKLLPFAATAPKQPLAGKEAAEKLYGKKGLVVSKDEANAIDLAVPRKVLEDLIGFYAPARRPDRGVIPFTQLSPIILP